MADKIKFLAGKLADLQNKPRVQGQVYFAIDGETGKIAFDVDGQTRVFMDKASSADSATQDNVGNVISKYIKTIQLLSDDDTRFQYILGDGSYIPSKTSGIRLNFVSRAGDTMTGLLTAKGGILINTATNTNNFIISRNGSAASECTTFGQNDLGLVIKSINDEASTSIRFDMEATDMESGAGAGANSGTITFGLSGGKTTVTADYFSGQASSAVKDASGNTIASTFIKNLILNNHVTQPYYQLVKGTGDNKSTVNLPVASTTNAGVVTVGAQSFKGQKTIIYDGTTTARQSSTLILSSGNRESVGLEFWRGDGGGASWQVINDGGYLTFKTDYNDGLQNTYEVTSLKLHFTTGAARAPYIWVNGANSSYRLYVNGKSYLKGATTISDVLTLGSTLSLNNDSYTANRMMWTDANKVAQASYHYVDSAKVGINYTSAPSTTFYVNGESTFNGNIILPVVNDDRFITFNYTSGDGYDWRIGYLGTGSGDSNYLVFQSSQTGTTFSNALRFGLTTLDAAFGGNVYPLDGSAGEQKLGTSTNRWPYIYGAIGNFSSTVTATTFMASTENALSTSGVMRIKSGSTMYLNRGASTSLIFQINGTGHARFDASGHFIPEVDNTYNIGSSSKKWKNIYATTFNGVLKTNNIVLQNAAAAQYGRLYIATEGTACATAGTSGTTGVALLILGNSTAVSSTVGEGANNARGRIRLYGTGANYIQLQAAPKTETNNYSFTLPPYEGNMYAAHTGSTDAVGSGVKPVYVGASGRITASSSTVGSGVKPIYLNAGTLTVSSSTVGSGIVPVFLSAGTLTASNNTVGSGIKPMFLNAGTLTASSSTVGSGVIPMFLSAGTLTASTSTVGNGIRPIYLKAGTLTASTTTVGTADRPVYLSSGALTQTTYRMAATNASVMVGVAINSTPQTGIWYVNETSDILGQSDGVAIVNHYNSNWVSQIYQDYRTGQIALRGKNNGTWQSWRTVIDTSNYTTHLDGRYVNTTGDTITGGIDLSAVPSSSTSYKMGTTSGANGGLHFRKKSGTNDWGNAITWAYAENDDAQAGIYVKSSGAYGTRMYFATTNLFADGAKAALEINESGSITALRGTFVGNLTGNASSASKVNNALTINGKTYNGSTAINVGTLGTAYGGTGVTTHTTNRLVWATSATTLQAGYHYANSTKVAINYTSEPGYNFYVNGTSCLNGTTSVTGPLTITGTGSSTANLIFKREGYNYIIFPSTGNLAFATAAKGEGIVVGVSSTAMYPYVNNAKSLGTSTLKWSNVYATTFTGNLSGKLVTARTLKVGDTGKSFDGGANVTWSASEIGYRHEWSTVVTCATWSRLCYVPCGASVIGSSYILNIGGTRNNVVYNDTFIIKTHHSNNGKIIKISGHNYSSGYQIRLLSNTDGSSYVELYDNAQSATNATTQTVICRLIPIHCGTPTKYTTFTTGATLPSGFSVVQTMTLTTVDIQGTISNAIKATQDGSGNTITSTYLKLSGGTMTNAAQIQRAGTSTSWYKGRANALIKINSYSGYNAIYSMKTTNGDWACGVYTGDILYWSFTKDTDYNANNNTVTQMRLDPNGYLYAPRVYNAIWNDYAEFRQADTVEPGRVVIESKFGIMNRSTARLQPGGSIVSDTYGHAMGKTEKCNTPIAVSGRVLAYPYEDIDEYEAGDAVCSGPNGTVSRMTREEIQKYPERIIGIVSEIPTYEIWGSENIKVNGRIWIKVK